MIHAKMMELGRALRRAVRRRAAPHRRRLLLESLEDRLPLAANLTVTDAFLTDGLGLRNNTPVLGEQIEVQVNFRTTDLFSTSAYRISVAIDGVALETGTIRSGAGQTAGVFSESLFGWYAEPDEHTVDIVIDSGGNVSEANEQDNTFSFVFTPERPVLPMTFVWPETDTPYQDHLLSSYVDLDPTSAVRDWRGGVGALNGHLGLDLGAANFAAMDVGRPVVAVADGVVIASVDGNQDRNTGFSGLPSNLVTIDHGDGWQTTYEHFRRDSVQVQVGDTVQQGEMLALEGSSGNSTQSHLHFDVRHHGRPVETFLDVNGYWMNPVGYVADQPFLVDSGTTNYNPSRHLAERPSNVDVISQVTGQTSYAWGVFSGLRDGDFVEVRWVKPNGVIHAGRNAVLTQDRNAASFVFSADLPTVPDLGFWTIDIRNNRELLGRQHFEVTAVGAPEIRIDDPFGEILLDERHSPVDYGTVAQKSIPPANTFTVVNHGTDTLVLGGVVAPHGYLITDGLGSALAPGSQETFTVSLNTSDAGYYAGEIRVFSEDEDEPIYNFAVEGTVTSLASETLTIGIGKHTIPESGTTVANVTRTGNINLPLTVDLTNARPKQASMPGSVLIPAGQASATFFINGINDSLEDGIQVVELTASAPDFAAATNSLNVIDVPTILVDIQENQISEAAGLAASEVTVVRIGGDLTASIEIMLELNDLTEAAIPLLVSMDPFQSIATVSLDAVDDDILDGPRTVTLTAFAEGFEMGVDSVQVLDHEPLIIDLLSTSVAEDGGAISGTITRSNTDNQDPLIIQLLSDDVTEATVPTEVTIPAGEASVPFPVVAVDDDLLDGDQTITITATAPAFVTGVTEILVTDGEDLKVTIADFTISESNGATTGTVSRSNVNAASPLRVSLSSSDTSEATVPPFVDIPANQMSVDFPVLAVDDNLLDGNLPVVVTPSAPGYRAELASLVVIDHETLSISYAQSSIFEDGGMTIGTVTRNNTNLNLAQSIALSLSDPTEVMVPLSVQIPANEASATFVVTSVDDMLIDGEQTVEITAFGGGYIPATESLTVSELPGLSITSTTDILSEDAPATTLTVQRHNASKSQALTVILDNSEPGQASVPSSVVILAGASTAEFDFTPTNDSLLDGTQTVEITASATSLADGTTTITVEDHETLTLSVNPAMIDENGTVATATITRSNSDTQSLLTVMISADDPSAATTPTSVTIPAAQASFDFSISPVDDALLDGTQTVTFTASAAGYQDATAMLDVLDHEELTVSLEAGSISESGGSVTGTVSRSNNDLGLPILVQLVSDMPDEASVGTNVLIPSQQSSATFTVSAVDDNLADGTQRVVISATATGYAGGSANLDVTDHETLVVTLDDPEISERNGMTSGVVTRGNTDIGNPLIVQLFSSDTSEAVVDGMVEIAPGETFAPFNILATNDSVFDGDQVVTISASAVDYVTGSTQLTVTDHENLTLNLDAPSISEQLGSTTATVSRGNTDLLLPTTVTVTTDLPNRTSVVEIVIIKAGKSASAPFQITAIDNHLLDGPSIANFSVAADGYVGDTKSLTVTDHETFTLALADSQITENGGQTTVVVRRNNVDIADSVLVSLAVDDPTEALISTSVVIPAHQAQSAPVPIFGIDDQVFDGTQTVIVSATALGYEPADAALQVTDLETLTVSINVLEMSELDGTATGTVTRLNTDINQELVVTLMGSDASEAMVPPTVSILANAPSATFPITARDDALFDGTQTFVVTAVAGGYAEATATIDVTDLETLTVSLAASEISEAAGRTTVRVTRSNTNVNQALAVTLAGGDPSEATFASDIIIPANSTSATTSINAVDDALLDGTQTLTLTARAAGYEEDSAVLDVTDHETLAISIADAVISELNGSTTATVTRSNLDDNAALTVTLTSSGELPNGDPDPNPPAVPLTIEIPAGQPSANFTVAAVDDDQLVGLRTAIITASATGFDSATAPVSIDDVETLAVTVDSLPLTEGGSTTGTITRSNSNLEGVVIVSLISGDPARVLVPQNVIIPIGQAATTFNITSLNDGVPNGTQTITVDVVANGYQPGSFGVQIQDVPFPWQNRDFHEDVNDDGVLTPADVLAMVNFINLNGTQRLPDTGPLGPPPFLDVNGDGFISPNDVVIAINEINRRNAESEGEGESSSSLIPVGTAGFPAFAAPGRAVRFSSATVSAVQRSRQSVDQLSQPTRSGGQRPQWFPSNRGKLLYPAGKQAASTPTQGDAEREALESLLDVLAADIARQPDVDE